jgi:hypothetical protein
VPRPSQTSCYRHHHVQLDYRHRVRLQSHDRIGVRGVAGVEPETWADLVRKLAAKHGVQGLSDKEIDFILWERTAWQFADRDYVCDQLAKLFARAKQGHHWRDEDPYQ